MLGNRTGSLDKMLLKTNFSFAMSQIPLKTALVHSTVEHEWWILEATTAIVTYKQSAPPHSACHFIICGLWHAFVILLQCKLFCFFSFVFAHSVLPECSSRGINHNPQACDMVVVSRNGGGRGPGWWGGVRWWQWGWMSHRARWYKARWKSETFKAQTHMAGEDGAGNVCDGDGSTEGSGDSSGGSSSSADIDAWGSSSLMWEQEVRQKSENTSWHHPSRDDLTREAEWVAVVWTSRPPRQTQTY